MNYAIASKEKKHTKKSFDLTHIDNNKDINSKHIIQHKDLIHQSEWINDTARTICHVCTRNFTTLRRKHHCRKCGEVVCGNCTIFKEVHLPVVGEKKVRICLSCMSRIKSPTYPDSTGHCSFLDSNNGSIHSYQTFLDEKRSGGFLSSSFLFLSPKSSFSPNKIDKMQYVDKSDEINKTKLDFSWSYRWPKPPILANESERLEALQNISAYQSLFKDINVHNNDIFDIVCELASKRTNCPMAAISFIDQEKQYLYRSIGFTRYFIPRNVSFCAHTIVSKEPLIIYDLQKDIRFQYNPLVDGTSKIRFYAGVPLICPKTSLIIGTIFVLDTKVKDKGNRSKHENLLSIIEKLANVITENLLNEKIYKGNNRKKNDIILNKLNPNEKLILFEQPQDNMDINNNNIETIDNTGEEDIVVSEITTESLHNINTKVSISKSNESSAQLNDSKELINHADAKEEIENQLYEEDIEDETSRSSLSNTNEEILNDSSLTIAPRRPQCISPKPNIENLLINLLSRTNDTQRHLAIQQKVMSSTLNNHSIQLSELTETIEKLNKKINREK